MTYINYFIEFIICIILRT